MGQFFLLLICLGFLGLTLWHNYFLKMTAKEYAAEAGSADATFDFTHAHFWLYEIKLYKFDANDSGTVPTDGTTEPAGKTEGQFEIYYFLVDQSWPKVHQEIQNEFVEAHNRHMRQSFEHPERFDKNGQPK